MHGAHVVPAHASLPCRKPQLTQHPFPNTSRPHFTPTQISINYEDDGRSLSSETRAAVEEEVKTLLTSAYARAKSVLKQHEKELHALAQVRGREGLSGV